MLRVAWALSPPTYLQTINILGSSEFYVNFQHIFALILDWILEPTWGRLGASWHAFGASWGVLGPLGVSRRPPRAPQARPGGVLGRLGGVFVANMVPTWLPKRSPNRSKNQCQNQSIFECLLGLDFYRILADFGRKMEPSWHSDGIKNQCQLRKMVF